MLRSLVSWGSQRSGRDFYRINGQFPSRSLISLHSAPFVKLRWFSAQPKPEEKMKKILSSTFPKAKSIEVVDVSGGCGAMYEIYVEAPQFKGLTIVKQHRLVTDALKEEIKDMHGLRIQTSPT